MIGLRALAAMVPGLRALVPADVRPGDIVVYKGKVDPITKHRTPGHCGIVVGVDGWTGDLPPSVLEAKRWVGRGVYGYGAGGTDPYDGTPFDRDSRGDCAAFVCHCLGHDRREDLAGSGYIYTDSMEMDARGPHEMFEQVIGRVAWRSIRVAHCAASRHAGPGAVRISDGQPWAKRGIVARPIANVGRA